MASTFGAAIDLMRPMNGVIGSMTVVLGGIITLNGQWDTQAIMAIGCLTLSLFLFTGMGHTLNDVLDASGDAINHPHRPIPSGRISAEMGRYAAIIEGVLSCLAMIAGAVLSESYHPAIIWTIAIVLMITYDIGPATKRLGLPGNLIIGLLVGMVVMFGGSAVPGGVTNPVVLATALAAFLAQTGREIIKDCEDMEGDEDRRTLPDRIGIVNARSAAYVFVMFALLPLMLPYTTGILDPWRIAFQAPSMAVLIMINRPLFAGEDSKAQKQVRMGQFLGILGFVASVTVLV